MKAARASSSTALRADRRHSGCPSKCGGSLCRRIPRTRAPVEHSPGHADGEEWEAARKEAAAHCACWAKGMPLQDGKRATTLERWQQVYELRIRNVSLLKCARRLGLSLNTVKRYGRASEPGPLRHVPKHRDYLRKRRAKSRLETTSEC